MPQNSTEATFNFPEIGVFPPPKKYQAPPLMQGSESVSAAPISFAPVASTASQHDGLQLGATKKFGRSLESKPYVSRLFKVHDPYPVEIGVFDPSDKDGSNILANDSWSSFSPLDASAPYEFIPEPLSIRVEFAAEIVVGFSPQISKPKNYYEAFRPSTIKPYASKSNARSYYSLPGRRSDVVWGSKTGSNDRSSTSVIPAFDLQFLSNNLGAGENETL
jgi:hypothetical protein